MRIVKNLAVIWAEKGGADILRKDRVNNLVRKETEKYSKEDFENGRDVGICAEKVASKLSIKRNNASADLNSLYREGKLIKIQGRPVNFLDRKTVEKLLGIELAGCSLEFNSACHLLALSEKLSLKGSPSRENNAQREQTEENARLASTKSLPVGRAGPAGNQDLSGNRGAFADLVGTNGSLKKAIESARAAILYPPQKLHTLLTGPTGVGKSTFAEKMYEYSIMEKKLPSDAPFIVFNCADYANNKELLLSQLFGHTRGAFTGADREKKGLVDQASGGILFLDEVHRLPPEGQEMLFLLLDKGIFRRLGETERYHRAKIFLIAATTEDPDEVLIKTFRRRLSVTIPLPGLGARPLPERFQLIKMFFQTEARRIGIEIFLPAQVIHALLLYNCPGNVGQLKNDVELLCAKGYMNYISRDDDRIYIDFSLLPEYIQKGLMQKNRYRKQLNRINELKGKGIVIYPDTDWRQIQPEITTGNFYREIKNKINFYKQRGLDEETITRILDKNINLFFETFQQNLDGYGEDRVSDDVHRAVSTVLEYAGKVLEYRFTAEMLQVLALHIQDLISKKINKGYFLPYFGHLRRIYPE